MMTDTTTASSVDAHNLARGTAAAPSGPVLLSENEIAAVAGGILIFPVSPPLGWSPEPNPAPYRGYTP